METIEFQRNPDENPTDRIQNISVETVLNKLHGNPEKPKEIHKNQWNL